VGIDADYTVHIRPDILSETDGPMLEHGIKKMEMTKLWVPSIPGEKPDPARLEVRFKEFVLQSEK
jgi:putative restriction endonuclease